MRSLAVAAVVLLAACGEQAPDRETEASQDGPYRAGGNEPFWAVFIVDGEMRLERPDQPTQAVQAPEPEPIPNGLRYDAGDLVLEVTHTPCQDTMSGFEFPDTARVNVPAENLTLEGCGGERIPGTGNP